MWAVVWHQLRCRTPPLHPPPHNPFAVFHPSHPWLLKTTDLILPFSECYVNGITECGTLYAKLLNIFLICLGSLPSFHSAFPANCFIWTNPGSEAASSSPLPGPLCDDGPQGQSMVRIVNIPILLVLCTIFFSLGVISFCLLEHRSPVFRFLHPPPCSPPLQAHWPPPSELLASLICTPSLLSP